MSKAAMMRTEVPTAAVACEQPLEHDAVRLFVRHADAGTKHEWIGPDADRPLSPLGWRQAKGLVGLLGDFPAARLLTSPALRCRQTLAPLVAAYGLDAEAVVELGTDSNIDRLLGLLEAPETREAVLCTHGEVLRSLMDRLGGRGTVDPPGHRQWDKGATCILKGDPRSRLSVCFLPPAVPLADSRRLAAQVGQRPRQARPRRRPGHATSRRQARRSLAEWTGPRADRWVVKEGL
jgi:broad specificity phosphatase PhoE